MSSAFPRLPDDKPGPPVVVIVFRDQRAYEPYQPRFNGKAVKVGGYFAVTTDSKTYNEGNRRSVFYAQSWLLAHYAFGERRDRWN